MSLLTRKKRTAGMPGGSLCCACCGTRYPGSDSLCMQCSAPLEISRKVLERGSPPNFVSVLGASGAGKTVYLGMLLDILSQGGRGLSGTATGAFSLAVQEQTIAALQARRFPDKTPSEADAWNWVHCEITTAKRSRPPLDLITPDFAGEAISLEMSDEGTFPAIRSTVLRSQGILLLCDSLRVRESPTSEDLFALKVATYVHSLHTSQGTLGADGKSAVPIGVVFTKCDRCPEARDDVASFAASNLPRLSRYFELTHAQTKFFAASVVGSSALLVDGYGRQSQLAFHVEPKGVIEPLQWIVGAR